MYKKTAIAILIIAVALTATAIVFADSESSADQDWDTWTTSNALWDSTDTVKKYKLGTDVNLTETWTVPTTDVNYLDLNGHTITITTNSDTITVPSGATLNLYDSSVSGGGIITHDATNNKFGVHNSGTFTMNGGTISNNSEGGVYTNSIFTLNNGTITGNGRGVNQGSGGTFTMNGGTISNNKCTSWGGGLYNDGTFNMNGGSIIGNTGKGGGGINNNNVVTMTGGTIADNTSEYRSDDDTQKGGGIRNKSTLNISGNSAIYGNKHVDQSGNIYAGNIVGGTINITGKLVDGANICVTYSEGTFTNGYGYGTINTEHPSTWFHSDYNYAVDLNNNEAKLVTTDGWTNWINSTSLWGAATGTVSAGSKLNTDVTLSGTWTVPTGINNLDLNGHTITITTNARTITVPSGATLNLYDSSEQGTGKITHSTYESGGETVKYKGCGVDIYGTFNMYSGTISGNNNEGQSGGGIHNPGGTFTMNGGTISNNEARAGGGIQSTGFLTINGGTITENKATMNTSVWGGGGGIDHWKPTPVDSFKISGSPIISGNKDYNNNDNNIVIDNGNGQMITITGELTGAANIGITCKATGVFTSGYGYGTLNTGHPSKWFHSDVVSKYVILNNNEASMSDTDVITNYESLERAIEAAESYTTTYSAAVRDNFSISSDTVIPNKMALTIDNTYTLTIDSSITLTNLGTIVNNGTIINNGIIDIQSKNGLTVGSTLTWDSTNKYYRWTSSTTVQPIEPTFSGAYVGLNGNITINSTDLIVISDPTGPITIGSTSASNAGGLAVINTGTAQNVTIQNVNTTEHGILLVNPATVTITGCTIGSSSSPVKSWLNSDSGIYAQSDVRDASGNTYTYTSYIKDITDGGGIIQVANASGDISITDNTINGASDINARGISTTTSVTGNVTINGNTLNGIGNTGIRLGGVKTDASAATEAVVVSGNTVSFANYQDSTAYEGRAIEIEGQNAAGDSVSITGNTLTRSYTSSSTYDVGGVAHLKGDFYTVEINGNEMNGTSVSTTYNFAFVSSASEVFIDHGAYASLSSWDYTSKKLFGTLNLINGSSISIANKEVVMGLTLNGVSLRNLTANGNTTVSVNGSVLTFDNFNTGKLTFNSGSNATLTELSGIITAITSDSVTFTPSSTADAPSADVTISKNNTGLTIAQNSGSLIISAPIVSGCTVTVPVAAATVTSSTLTCQGSPIAGTVKVNGGTMRLDQTINVTGSIELADSSCSLKLGDGCSYWGNAPTMNGTASTGWVDSSGTEHASVEYTNDTGADVTAYWA